KLKATTLTGNYIYSTENDYESHNINIGFSQDLFEKNSTLALGYSYAYNNVGRAGDQIFHERLQVHGIGASWTQVFTRKTIGQLSYSFAYNDGYQASPYRFVSIFAADDYTVIGKVREQDPAQRYRHAFVAALNQHIGEDSAFQADYRLYFDNWGIAAH